MLRITRTPFLGFRPLRSLSEDASGEASKDTSGCGPRPDNYADTNAWKTWSDCQKAYWGQTAGDCAKWEQYYQQTKSGNTDAATACENILRAKGQTPSGNACLELVHSCSSTVACQVANYMYAGGLFTSECGKYGDDVASVIWPVWNNVLNLVQGKPLEVPCFLQGDNTHAQDVLSAVWHAYRGWYDQYADIVNSIQMAWLTALAKFGLPPQPVCIEPSILGVSTTLTEFDGPPPTDPNVRSANLCDTWPDTKTMDRDRIFTSMAGCACGKGYNAEHALLAWASQNSSNGGIAPYSSHRTSVGGHTVTMFAGGIDYANTRRPLNGSFGSRAVCPFNIGWEGDTSFKKCDTTQWNNVQREVHMVVSVMMDKLREAILPVTIACMAQAAKMRQSSTIPFGPSAPPAPKANLQVARPPAFQLAPSKPPLTIGSQLQLKPVGPKLSVAPLNKMNLQRVHPSTSRSEPNYWLYGGLALAALAIIGGAVWYTSE